MENRKYIAIDLKSFYASVECSALGLDPLTTNLVVADSSRTEKTICLAVSPSLKAYGLSGRCRLFEVIQKLNEVNEERRRKAPHHRLGRKSSNAAEIAADPSIEVDYIAIRPHMARYIEKSTEIYSIYLKYIAPEDIHVYSIDEVFMDVTAYLKSYGCNAHELAKKIILDVLSSTGITATAGIGSNLYLCKVALDIQSKHIKPDADNVRIAELDEMSYRQLLWGHRPITDFWRVGRGYGKRLEEHRLYTMGDIARCSLQNEALLYRLFGVNAELLIDHAWGYEPCTIKDIKEYRPDSSSIGSGQVLACGYTSDKARIVVREMADSLSLELVRKKLKTDQIVLVVGYDIDNLKSGDYQGEIKKDFYGRAVPKAAHGSQNLSFYTSSSKEIETATARLFDRITDSALLIRRMYLTANHVIDEDQADSKGVQLDLFDEDNVERKQEKLDQEKRLQQALLSIKDKYGKNAILRGMDYEEGATARERNNQIGGHKA